MTRSRLFSAPGAARAGVADHRPLVAGGRTHRGVDLLALQRLAGNRAAGVAVRTAGAVDVPRPAPVAVARAPASNAPAAAPIAAGLSAGQARLTSPDGDVNGRSVAEVGAELQARNARYKAGIARLLQGSLAAWTDETGWAAELGALGRLVGVFNAVKPPDPERWRVVIADWDFAAERFGKALATPVTVEEINRLGRVSSGAMHAYRIAVESDRNCRETFRAYVEGFTHSADTLHTVATVTRDIAFGSAVAVATVVAAPAVATAAAALGLGSTTTTVVTVGAMGATGAAVEGAGRGLSTLGGQALVALTTAGESFNFADVRHQTWVGLKQGFVDGVLGFAGIQAERALARAGAAAAARLFGPNNAGLMSMILRRALIRATAAGATGSVVGALEAGYRAAEEGRDLAGITAAMQTGFKVGAALGVGGGAIGGALEARSAEKVRQTVQAALRAVDKSESARATNKIKGLLAELRENPAAGTNPQLLSMLPAVVKSLGSRNAIAQKAVDIWLERNLLGYVNPNPGMSRYGQAAEKMTRRTGAPTTVIPRDQKFEDLEFFDQVVVSGKRFVDLSANVEFPGHGAYTHLIQDLLVDEAVKPVGLRAEQFRALLRGAVGRDGSNEIGNSLWIAVFDASYDSPHRPEILHPALSRALRGLE